MSRKAGLCTVSRVFLAAASWARRNPSGFQAPIHSTDAADRGKVGADENKALVRQLYEQGWQNGDLTVVDRVFAPEHVLHWNDLRPVDQHRTTGQVKQIVEGFRAAVPDLKVTIDQLVSEGDQVVVQVTFEGTHTGRYEAYAPTNERIRFTDMQILRFSGGRIVESSLPAGGLVYFLSMLDGTLFRDHAAPA